jgi:drug/metabolite transporter (DMT)-like permease
LMISAFRYADATTLASLVYLELAGAVALGFLFFGEVPGSGTLFGAGLIVCAGLCLTGLEPDPAPTHIETPGERLGHPRNTSSSKG